MPRRTGDMLRVIHRGLQKSLEILLNPQFQNAIFDLRSQWGLDIKEIRLRAKQLLAEGEYTAEYYETYARQKALFDLIKERGLWIGNGVRSKEFAYEWIRVIKQLSSEGLPIDIRHITAGLCFDPIGLVEEKLLKTTNSHENKSVWLVENEDKIIDAIFTNEASFIELRNFFVYCEIGHELFDRVFFYDSQRERKSFREWASVVAMELKPNHTYIDVTGLDFDKVQLIWAAIEGVKETLGDYSKLSRGRPKNITPRYEVLRGMTWNEVRAHIRENPKELIRLEHEYVNQQGKRDPRLRGNAIRNFYKQVIVHPDMKGLGLRIRKRG